MDIKGFHHVAVHSDDVERSLKFYQEALGGKLVHSFPLEGSMAYLIDFGGGAVVEILPRGNGKEEENPRWQHIAAATDDARASFEYAVKAGAEIDAEPEDCMLGTMAVCIAFVKGPDGEVIEFFQEK